MGGGSALMFATEGLHEAALSSWWDFLRQIECARGLSSRKGRVGQCGTLSDPRERRADGGQGVEYGGGTEGGAESGKRGGGGGGRCALAAAGGCVVGRRVAGRCIRTGKA